MINCGYTHLSCVTGLSRGIYRGNMDDQVSNKSWVLLLLLSIFLGGLGIDRFYLGKIGTGILKLITFGGLGAWWLIDIILVVTGRLKDSHGLLVKSVGVQNDPIVTGGGDSTGGGDDQGGSNNTNN